MEISELEIPGCKVIKPRRLCDNRGEFIKIVHGVTFAGSGLEFGFREQYYSVSRREVVRGMHFQIPPHEHDKLVYCMNGAALDVVVDLRRGSPGFRKVQAVRLEANELCGVYVPRGCAHGFLSLTDDCIMLYCVTTEYAPEHDRGIRWDSFEFSWPCKHPIVSPRDSSLPSLNDFVTPFGYGIS